MLTHHESIHLDTIHNEIDAQHEQQLEASEHAEAMKLYAEQMADALMQMFGI